jgi:hypothetical protein
MGSAQSIQVQPDLAPKKKTASYFVIDRLLASECSFLPETMLDRRITLGVLGDGLDKDCTHFLEGIRIGELPIARLHSFQEGPNFLQFEFENNIHLSVVGSKDKITYSLKTKQFSGTDPVHPVIANRFKPIGLPDASEEIDRLSKVFHLKETEERIQ